MRSRPNIPPFFPVEFYTKIVREIDPQQEITEEALVKFNQLAQDFLTQVFQESTQLVRGRGISQGGNEVVQVTADDVHYVLQNRFGMSLSVATRPVPDFAVRSPTEEYRDKLRTVRECASHQDD
jgi:histone H3/H4